jgi:hypothetical protein
LHTLEIIGNIYENPELLKESERWKERLLTQMEDLVLAI